MIFLLHSTYAQVMQGAEPAELMSLLDPPLLDPEAARLHARRASMAEELATGSTACNPAGALGSVTLITTVPLTLLIYNSFAAEELPVGSTACNTAGALGPLAYADRLFTSSSITGASNPCNPAGALGPVSQQHCCLDTRDIHAPPQLP